MSRVDTRWRPPLSSEFEQNARIVGQQLNLFLLVQIERAQSRGSKFGWARIRGSFGGAGPLTQILLGSAKPCALLSVAIVTDPLGRSCAVARKSERHTGLS
jgi:hypothetical protein